MERKVAAVYTAFSVLAFVALTSWLAFAFFQTRSDNLTGAAGTFEDISNSTAISLDSAGRFDAPQFSAFVRSLFLELPSLDVLAISTASGGVRFVYARNPVYLVTAHAASDSWSGAIRYNKLTQRLFSGSLPVTERSAGTPLHIRAVFTLLSGTDIYSIARIVLICLLSFVILTVIVILIAPPSGTRAPRGATPGAGSDREPAGGADGRSAGPAQEKSSPGRSSVIVLGPPPEPMRDEPFGPAPASGRATGPSHETPSPPEQSAAVPGDAEGEWSDPEPASPELDDVSSPNADGTLPPDIQLPSLREVTGGADEHGYAASELSLYDSLTDARPDHAEPLEVTDGLELIDSGSAPVEITEIEDTPRPSESGHSFADEELADIEDYEDLERIDGSPGGDGFEPPPHPRAGPLAPRVPRGDSRSDPSESGPGRKPPAPAPGGPEEEPDLVEELSSEPDPPTVPDGNDSLLAELDEPSEGDLDELFVPGPEDLPPVEPSDSSAAVPERSAIDEALPDLSEAFGPGIAAPDPHGEPLPDAPLPAAVAGTHARDLFNPESGLAWQDHLEQRLSFELGRAASFDQDLAVSVVRFAQPADEVARLNFAREIRTYFPFHDLCFEYGKDSFAIVLPNTDIDQAIRSMENFNDKMNDERPGSPKMLFGLSARNGRLLGSERLLSEADSAVEKAREDGRNSIFALRVDPGKYREFIKSTLK